MRIDRPTELNDLFSYMLVYGPDQYPEEDEWTASQVMADAIDALNSFAESTRTGEGREAVLICKRNLQIAYEYGEKGDTHSFCMNIQETEELFRNARKYITISDE